MMMLRRVAIDQVWSTDDPVVAAARNALDVGAGNTSLKDGLTLMLAMLDSLRRANPEQEDEQEATRLVMERLLDHIIQLRLDVNALEQQVAYNTGLLEALSRFEAERFAREVAADVEAGADLDNVLERREPSRVTVNVESPEGE